MKSLALLLLASALAILPVFAQRETLDLPDGWKFIKQDVPLTAATDTWEKITVPHTWNNLDGQDGKKAEPDLKDGYYRGACWYARTLDLKPEWKSKRVFIRFEAASTVAQVYLDGQSVGEHKGGFTAFCFELTDKLRWDGPNDLRIRVDNSARDDVPPLTGDFDVMGGIYRPVHLIVTDKACISPLDSASSGVYFTMKELTSDYAVLEVRVVVSNGARADKFFLRAEVSSSENRDITYIGRLDGFLLQAGETKSLTFQIRVPPRIWNGTQAPYLYKARVRLSEEGAFETVGVDSISQFIGLRTVAVTNEQGFLLNGQPYPIHGVDLHQDKRDLGWAMGDADHEEDFKLMKEMGVTAVRLAHYPQSEKVHEIADREGILLWDEIPLVNAVKDTPEFKANASQQLREMILQRYNHPSAAFWGLFNEMSNKLDPVATPIFEQLKKEQQELDPTRISVAASCFNNCKFNRVPDWICFNPYFGWYYGKTSDMGKYIDDRYHENGDKRIGISEYGAGSNVRQHQDEPLTMPKAGGPFHPEEWQTQVHEEDWAQIKDNPKLWGSFLWCMFDFASDHRDEGGQPGINDKGMVTADRKILKDSYFFYQANWTDTPMVHINGRRFVDRTASPVEVKVYSNCPSVELIVNGKSLGKVTPDSEHICRWKDVALRAGTNQIEADAAGVTDKCGWLYTPGD